MATPHYNRMHLRSPWHRHPELNLILKKLWQTTNTSANEIAALPEFRAVGITRSGIIGRAHRLGLERPAYVLHGRRPKDAREKSGKNFIFGRHVSPPRERIVMPATKRMQRAELAAEHLQNMAPVGIFRLADRGCRFVVDGDRDTTLFCNTIVPDHTGPIGHWCYCAYHRGLMFSKTNPEVTL